MKVNGVKLAPLQPVTLRDGDHVQLGVPPAPCQAAPYVWVFCEKLRVKRKTFVRAEMAGDRKRPLADSQQTASQPDVAMAIPVRKKLCVSVPGEWSPSQDLHRKLEQEEERMREQMRRQEEKLEELRQQLEEKDLVQVAMETEIRAKEEELREELRKEKVRRGEGGTEEREGKEG